MNDLISPRGIIITLVIAIIIALFFGTTLPFLVPIAIFVIWLLQLLMNP